MNVRKIAVISACCAAVFLIVIILVMANGSHGSLLVVNKAAEDIVQLTVEVCRQKHEIGALQRGASKRLEFRIRGESDYSTRTVFASGKVLTGTTGYVDSAFDESDTLIIEKDSISLSDRSVKLKLGF